MGNFTKILKSIVKTRQKPNIISRILFLFTDICNGSDQRQVKLHYEKKHKATALPLKTDGIKICKSYKFKCEFCQYSVSDTRSLRGHLELKHSSEIRMENNYLKDEILEFTPKVLRIENYQSTRVECPSIKKEIIDTKSNLSNLRLRLRLGR